MIRRGARATGMALTLLVLWVMQVDAGGPGTGGRRVRLDDEPAGPYLVRVVTSPTPPRVETLYLEIRVEDPATGKVVTDASVQARAEFLDGMAPSVADEATHDIAPNPVEYGVHLPVSEPGRWQVHVHIEGEAGDGEVQFEEQIARQTSLSSALVVGLPIGALLALVIVFLSLQRQRGRRQSAD